jgi:hypothetical protein
MKKPQTSNQDQHLDPKNRDENRPPFKEKVETRRNRPPAHPLFRRSKFKSPLDFKTFKPLVNAGQLKTYDTYNQAVLQHIRKRRKEHAYEPLDDHIVDMLARTFANWIFLEEYLSQDPDLLAKHADSLSKLNRQILDLWDELDLTPSGRRKLLTELKKQGEQDEKINQIYEKLIGSSSKGSR